MDQGQGIAHQMRHGAPDRAGPLLQGGADDLHHVGRGHQVDRHAAHGQHQALDAFVVLRQPQMAAHQSPQGVVDGAQTVFDFVLPQAGGIQHLAHVQAHAVAHGFALLERRQHAAVEAVQRLLQAQAGIVPAVDLFLHVAAGHRLQKGAAVQTLLVAEVVADGRDVGARCLGNGAGGGAGKALLGKQPQRLAQQALARELAVAARRARRLVGRQGGIQGDHDAGLQHEINRLIEIPAIRSD